MTTFKTGDRVRRTVDWPGGIGEHACKGYEFTIETIADWGGVTAQDMSQISHDLKSLELVASAPTIEEALAAEYAKDEDSDADAPSNPADEVLLVDAAGPLGDQLGRVLAHMPNAVSRIRAMINDPVYMSEVMQLAGERFISGFVEHGDGLFQMNEQTARHEGQTEVADLLWYTCRELEAHSQAPSRR